MLCKHVILYSEMGREIRNVLCQQTRSTLDAGSSEQLSSFSLNSTLIEQCDRRTNVACVPIITRFYERTHIKMVRSVPVLKKITST